MSFMDRIAGPEGWLSRFRWWVWVPAGWLVTLVVLQAPLWISGSSAFPEFMRDVVLTPFYFVAPVAGYAYLTRTARSSFDRFRPALEATDDEVTQWRERIATTSPVTAMVVFLIGGGLLTVATYSDVGSAASDIMRSSGLATAVWGIGNFVSFGFHFVVGALILRQVRLVAHLHDRAAHIDLFRPDPLHAFASLTARAGAVVVGLVVYSAFTDPATFENQAYLSLFIIGIVIGVATFLLPLLGMRSRLRHEKHRLRDQVAGRLSTLTAELHAAIDARRLGEVGDLKTALDVLGGEQQRIRKTSAWPWETATIRGFATTMLVPVTIWLITSLLSQSLGL